MDRKSSFPPIVRADARVLILGSLPGDRSLAEGRYYAHPRNQFWRLLGAVIGQDLAAMDYEARLAALTEARIGLWDTVASARRQGSLDTAIRDARHNALAELVSSLPGLRAVAFNGAAAARSGSAMLAGASCALIALPSSSPAFAAMRFEEKLALWRAIGNFIE